jgi:hypothetical protein
MGLPPARAGGPAVPATGVAAWSLPVTVGHPPGGAGRGGGVKRVVLYAPVLVCSACLAAGGGEGPRPQFSPFPEPEGPPEACSLVFHG